MGITIVQDAGTVMNLSGQLDTLSAIDFENEIRNVLENFSGEIVVDVKELTYISSAGLRLLLTLQKGMTKKGGSVRLRNIRREIMEIFDITGFSSILTIE